MVVIRSLCRQCGSEFEVPRPCVVHSVGRGGRRTGAGRKPVRCPSCRERPSVIYPRRFTIAERVVQDHVQSVPRLVRIVASALASQCAPLPDVEGPILSCRVCNVVFVPVGRRVHLCPVCIEATKAGLLWTDFTCASCHKTFHRYRAGRRRKFYCNDCQRDVQWAGRTIKTDPPKPIVEALAAVRVFREIASGSGHKLQKSSRGGARQGSGRKPVSLLNK